VSIDFNISNFFHETPPQKKKKKPIDE